MERISPAHDALQRLTGLFRGRVAVERHLRLVETLPLGPRRSLLLVECDGVRFLVSAGGDHLSGPVPLHSARTDGGSL